MLFHREPFWQLSFQFFLNTMYKSHQIQNQKLCISWKPSWQQNSSRIRLSCKPFIQQLFFLNKEIYIFLCVCVFPWETASFVRTPLRYRVFEERHFVCIICVTRVNTSIDSVAGLSVETVKINSNGYRFSV